MVEDAFLELLTDVCGALEAVGAAYAITGSLASSLHGQPSSSLDVDIGTRLTVQQARGFAQTLPAHCYRDEDSLVNAVRTFSVANIIDQRTGAKADVSVLPRKPFFSSVLQRRVRRDYRAGGPAFWTVSAEDVVLMKLLWRKDTRSSKQWENALSVVRVQGARMDWKYLAEWADRLNLVEDLERLKSEGGI